MALANCLNLDLTYYSLLGQNCLKMIKNVEFLILFLQIPI